MVYSVIIPVYNIELNLRRCIDSFLKQTFCDFEIILVDDGSTDSSGIICDEYAASDQRVHAIHKKNNGVSSARNTGLNFATGDYILFADSDDFVEKEFLEKLSHSDSDLVIVGFYDYYMDKITKTLIDLNRRWQLNSIDGIKIFLNTCGSVFVWGKRYRSTIIKKHGLRFREEMKVSEDIVFNNAYILASSTAETISWAGYYHCQYDFPTLSSKYRMSFVEKNYWREIAYKQFSAYPEIQNIYMNQLLYFAEKEFINISNSNLCFKSKSNEVRTIISDIFFITVVKKMPNVLPRVVRFFCIRGWASMIVIKYSNKRRHIL